MPWVASAATAGMLLVGLPAAANAADSATTPTPGTSASTTTSVAPSADTTLQSWGSEKTQSMAGKPYVGALQAANKGVFGEQFESSDTADGTDAKTGLLSFDLSDYDSAPDSATFEMTYLGYRPNTTFGDDVTDTIKVTPVDITNCTGDASSCAPATATWAQKPKFSITDTSWVAESAPFKLNTGIYYSGDSITVDPNKTAKVTVDVTAMVRQQFANGNKVITLAVGETQQKEVRFASTEGASSMSGATADMAPKLTITTSPKDTVKASADTTLQAWMSEKTQKNNTKPYVGALQPNDASCGADGCGDFGEKFKSSDTNNTTDGKMGLMTFDLSEYTSAPEHSTLALTYLGYVTKAAASTNETVKVTAVDDTQCTGTEACDTDNATWANRPDFTVGADAKVAASHKFDYGTTTYSDQMTVDPAKTQKVIFDVTDIVKEQFAAGKKKITFALGETQKSDVRFASKEGAAGGVTGATADMVPTLSVTKKPKAYTLAITKLPKVKYELNETYDGTGLEVSATSTADGTTKVLDASEYTVDSSAFDGGNIGAYPITVTYNKDPEITTSFNTYVIAKVEDGGDGDTSKDDWLWYEQPASGTDASMSAGSWMGDADNNRWQQTTLPIGNGKLGGTVWGEVGKERVTFNEETLQSGGPGSTATYNGGNEESRGKNGETLRTLNKQLENGAETVNPGNLTGGLNDNEKGSYLNWGNLYLDYGFGSNATVTDYKRDLNLSKGKADVTFKKDGVTYTREFFASNPDNVMVARLKASEAGKLNLNVSLPSNTGWSKNGETTTVKGDTLTVKGALGSNGLLYNAKVKAVIDNGDGTISTGADGTSLKISDAQYVTLYIAAATDYKQEYPKYRTGETAAQVDTRVAKVVQDAANKGYTEVKKAHLADQAKYYNRVKLDLGQTTHSSEGAIATDKLLKAYKNGKATDAQKRELETLVYNYGRYLTIASSRENSQLPSNLQGIWSVTASDKGHGSTPWDADFHMNVNLQMNYWPTYSSDLGELAEPLIKYVEGLVKPGRVTAKVYAGAETADANTPIGEGEGFMAHTENTAYGWTAPGYTFSWGWSPAAVPWILQNVYEAYEYSGDAKLLDRVYALLKEESHFYVNYMLHKAGSSSGNRLTTGVAYSPEHGPVGTDGNTYENSLVWQMLNDAIEAAEAKGDPDNLVGDTTDCSTDNWAKDDSGAFTNANANRSWSCAKSLLKPIEVGKSGQIKEWYFEGELGKKADGSAIPSYDLHHRHLSHMLGLFPGDLITVDNSQYMDAAKYSLTQRGDDATGWGVGQRINSWARTGDGNHAYKLIELQLKGAMYANLFDAHPPFQIDGNFGNTSGVNEMLVQSNSTFTATDGKTYANYTNILPALPDAWSSGSIKGLVARGNFGVDVTWANGAATEVKLTSNNGKQAAVKITAGDAANYEVKDADGNAVASKTVKNEAGASLLVFDTAKGATYTITKKTVVNVPVTGVTVTGADTATAGDTVTLTATVAPDNATDKSVTWKSSDESVATVDGNGVVTTKKAGTVTITATSNADATKSGSHTITVTARTVPVESVTVKGDAAMTVGGEQTLTATVTPENATDKTVTWSTSDAAVATVDGSGVVTAVAPGTVTITATAGGKSGSLTITVSDKAPETVPVQSVTVTGDKTMTVGGEQTLTATVTPADATDKTVTWKSSDVSVATVNADGKVVANKAGTVTITATANDGSGKSGSIDITVNDKEQPEPEPTPVTKVVVTSEGGITTVTEGNDLQLTATVSPADATDKTVTWKSSDESVATVDANGKLTAKKAGTVTITATANDGSGVSGSIVITVKAKDNEKPTPKPNYKNGETDLSTVEAGKATTISEPKAVAGWATRSILKQGKLGTVTIGKDGKLVYTAGAKTGTDSFVVRYTMANGDILDLTYPVKVVEAKGGLSKTGAAVSVAMGAVVLLAAAGAGVMLMRRRRA
ncbi:alpha-L-fucosidase [Bifidobacterium leontopitheci]|uniref:Alpha-L-fucosidase n=2 Tax=Bifidobacterium leontopitheci TaxID=2650774 RepID=A0A6I1GEY5_9BIFI|nr:alpha-L-fucosidase [Bifidobacterium leontopitheci]